MNVADLAAVLAFSVATLALSDLLLSDSQKASLALASLWLWNRLDEARKLPFIDFFRKVTHISPRSISVIFAGLTIGTAFREKYPFSIASAIKGVNTGILAIILIFCVRFIVNAKTPIELLLRSIIVPVGSYGALLAMAALGYYFRITSADVDATVGRNFVDLVFTILSVVSIGVAFFLCLIYLLMGILISVEFVVRRIAENPKGPILGLSALLGIFAAYLKIFL